MKLNFSVTQVNSPFEDTAFFVRNTYKKRSLLFDCGKIGGLTNQEVLSIYDIFISHTHIDHFYGFDRILRGSIMADKTIRIFGPPGIIRNVRGKVESYTWNLIKSYPIRLEVVELDKSMVHKHAFFKAENGFEPEYSEIAHDDIDLGDGFIFDFEFFDHRVTSAGYKLTESRHIAADKDAMAENGLKPDKWLGELKEHLAASGDPERRFTVDTVEGAKEFSSAELEGMIIRYTDPQSITFITDIAPSYDNYRKAVEFAENSTILLIEGVFMKEDILHAMEKKHLTLDLAKQIYRRSGSKFVRFFHFAPRYDRMRPAFMKRLYEGFEGNIL